MTEKLEELIRRYNVLVCPRSGIPKLTKTGNISKQGLKIPKRKKEKKNVS